MPSLNANVQVSVVGVTPVTKELVVGVTVDVDELEELALEGIWSVVAIVLSAVALNQIKKCDNEIDKYTSAYQELEQLRKIFEIKE